MLLVRYEGEDRSIVDVVCYSWIESQVTDLYINAWISVHVFVVGVIGVFLINQHHIILREIS